MDSVDSGLTEVWSAPLHCSALIRDVPDAASVALLALLFGWQADDAVRQGALGL